MLFWAKMIAGKEKFTLLTIHFRMSWFKILMMRIINLVYRAKIRLMLHLLRRLTLRMTLAIMMRIKMIWRRKNMTALKRMLWCFTISWRMASRLFLSITIEDLSRFIKHSTNRSTTRISLLGRLSPHSLSFHHLSKQSRELARNLCLQNTNRRSIFPRYVTLFAMIPKSIKKLALLLPQITKLSKIK